MLKLEIAEMIFAEDRPFQSCHASTLAVLANGQIAAAWFGGTAEGNPDVAIWFSKRIDGRWTAPVIAADHPGEPLWNPVLFSPDGERLILYYKAGHQIPRWHTMVMESLDGGQTWSEAAPLVPGDIGGRGPVKNKPIILEDGTWAAPASLETEEYWDAFVDLSTDDGRTWVPSAVVPLNREAPGAAGEPFGKGVIQPTLWESQPGHVHMLLRSTAGWIFRSDSTDGGRTWCEAYPTELPNNNSGIDLVKMGDGTLALVHNPVAGNWAARTPLVVSVSKDNGQTWAEAYVLEDEPGEHSYPAIVCAGDEIHITYTWKRESIAYRVFTLGS